MKLRIGRTISNSAVNGPGERFVVWTQGCGRRCPGCSNVGLLPRDGGVSVDVAELAAEIGREPAIRGVTLSGGEPLDQAEAAAELLRLIDPRLDSVVFTGCTIEEVRADPAKALILESADFLVAGPFVQGLASEAGRCIGSSNQTLHALTGRIREEDWPPQGLEVHISSQGDLALTGFFPAKFLT
ncbi:MAG: 4Fe-4S single cluster domain-containing protein [Elusimicrobiota bacterium]|jgi:anaerobic ribonucleoside-triphosphate reductase activating protein